MIGKAIILGIIQGLTEFLPVSSSGHLAVAKALFGFETEHSLSFDVAVHVATLLAVVIVFRRDIWNAIRGFFLALPVVFRAPKRAVAEHPQFRLGLLIVLATIPAGVAGFLVRDIIEDIPLIVVGISFIVTAAIVGSTFFFRNATEGKDASSLGVLFALVVGVFQAFAIMPGISRSGSTISAALFMGGSRAFAGVFSFLLSIPVILGALVLEAKDIAGIDVAVVAAGFISAFVSGFLALKLLMVIVKRGRLYFFSIYCAAVGVATIIYSVVR